VKLFGWVLVALFAVLTAGAVGARWLGQQGQNGPGFPLPDENGCWNGFCFASLPPEDVLARLRDSRRVAPASVTVVEGLQPGGYDPLIAFTWTDRPERPLPVLLYWATHSYHLTRDWRQDANPALMSAGDVLAALGPPDRVSLLVDQVGLHYVNRRLEMLVVPSRSDLDQAELSPGDAVIGLFVISGDSPPAAETVYYPPSSSWQGFGLIRFATQP
jgi:hypothetical protein